MDKQGMAKRYILEALEEVMESEPLANVSVTELCDHGGFSRKTFYYHFEDKFKAVIWRFQQEFLLEKAEDLARCDTDAWRLKLQYLASRRRFYANALSCEGPGTFAEFFITQAFLLDYDIYRPGFKAIGESEDMLVAASISAAENERRMVAKWLSYPAETSVDQFIEDFYRMNTAIAIMTLTGTPFIINHLDETPGSPGQSEDERRAKLAHLLLMPDGGSAEASKRIHPSQRGLRTLRKSN